MSTLTLIKNTLNYNGIDFVIDDLYTKSFYEYSNKVADSYRCESFLVNEMFLYIIQPYLALDFFIQNNNVDSIQINSPNLAEGNYLMSLSKKYNIRINKPLVYSCHNLIARIKCYFEIGVTYLYISYLMLRIPFNKRNIKWDEFAVLRDKASRGKMKRFVFHKEDEDLWNKESVYSLFPVFDRLWWCFMSLLSSITTIKTDSQFLNRKIGTGTLLYDRYGKRILHTNLYANLLDNLFRHNAGSKYYTGLNLERFAIVEDVLAKKYNLKTFNIPHGLEYGFKFPVCFTSDTFYANTQYAADYLNQLYDTNKFIFDSGVTTKMFKLEGACNHPKYIIFFTEPREVNVNIDIIKSLKPFLDKEGITLYVKLHPADKESNYLDLGVEFIKDYASSLVGNICISRKSTILLEAIYNNSLPVAIIINNKDYSTFDNFPSLNSDKIIKTYSVEELFKIIMQNY